MEQKLKLGLIGFSIGNGHPYSWAAILNGYDRKEMAGCGFPSIYSYLDKQKWPQDQIYDATVVTVWTQSQALSHKIARAANISHVSGSITELVGICDAVLLARDDAENHLKFAEPALALGLPIFIDKPLALSLNDLKALYGKQLYPGQIFSCSALRYSSSIIPSKGHPNLDDCYKVIASAPKSWEKYGVHLFEGVFRIYPQLINEFHDAKIVKAGDLGGSRKVIAKLRNGFIVEAETTGASSGEISFQIFFKDGHIVTTNFDDPFLSFKSSLEDFLIGARARQERSPERLNYEVVRALEVGVGQ